MISFEFSYRPARDVAGALRAGATAGLRLAGELVLQRSNDRVPLEEGTLERSGRVTATDDEVAISYDTVYAVCQHEDMSLRHDAGRSAKYLETALGESRSEAAQLIAAAIRKAAG